MPGMAFDNSLEGEPTPFFTAVLFHGLKAVFGTMRIKPTALPEQGANRQLV